MDLTGIFERDDMYAMLMNDTEEQTNTTHTIYQTKFIHIMYFTGDFPFKIKTLNAKINSMTRGKTQLMS